MPRSLKRRRSPPSKLAGKPQVLGSATGEDAFPFTTRKSTEQIERPGHDSISPASIQLIASNRASARQTPPVDAGNAGKYYRGNVGRPASRRQLSANARVRGLRVGASTLGCTLRRQSERATRYAKWKPQAPAASRRCSNAALEKVLMLSCCPRLLSARSHCETLALPEGLNRGMLESLPRWDHPQRKHLERGMKE
jgi:hypothetical protein